MYSTYGQQLVSGSKCELHENAFSMSFIVTLSDCLVLLYLFNISVAQVQYIYNLKLSIN